ncbi:unnamed protein product [Rhizophagus irregularis]|nr:unnamed protein product [Rhizophagus irregularis]
MKRQRVQGTVFRKTGGLIVESAPKWIAEFQGIGSKVDGQIPRNRSDVDSRIPRNRPNKEGIRYRKKLAPNIPNSVEIGSGVESRIQRNCFGMDNQQYKLRKVSASLGVSAFMGGYEVFLEGFG